MGMRRRTRIVLVASIALLTIVGAAVGVRVWFDTNQREKTDAAFTAMRVVDQRIDLRSVIPDARRTETGVAVRPLGAGPGPSINYAFDAAATPDWKARVGKRMEAAGFGENGEPWFTQVGDEPVSVTMSGATAGGGGPVYLVMSTS
ncbi:hypothetical protein DEJ32_05840 [Curtobacterium sp. MCPF17_046]|nr:hypothetical protein DEJ32_05840 [Curtobacterium sp. MCPF17_046]